jgi:hypothetical protein
MFTRALNFNRLAERWARRHGKPMVGNGDVHRLYQLGTCYSLVDAERTPDAICAAIREGRVRVAARPLSIVQAARTIGDMFATDVAAWWSREPAGSPQETSPQTRAA